MHHAGFDLDRVREGYAASRSVFVGKKSRRRYPTAGAKFIRYLEHQGVLSESVPAQMKPRPQLEAFRCWMRQHRGVGEATLDNWQRDIVALLDAVGQNPDAYTAVAIRRFVRRRCKSFGVGRAKSVAVALRAYLRFLIATRQCPAGRDHAVPSFANWQLAAIPRYLLAEDVERVIAACAGQRRLRDRAIVLLLARLGLRAGEVAKLKLSDIDWRNGRVAILSSKSKRSDWLPLTQEVGDAIIAYLECARPRQRSPRVFLTEFAPTRPMTRITVKCIVRRALIRAGVESPNLGAHVLRHSAATAMLRNGVSLDGVRAVLRHASPQMTMHYAKVDIGLLSEIAQPWAGRLPC